MQKRKNQRVPSKSAPLIEWALYYHRLVWCIIPIPYGSKKAQIKWGKYQESRPDEEQARRWFANGEINIAVVLGEVSGDLVCRDFDTVEEYQSWAKTHLDLAAKLPTVRTAHGYHVYFEARLDGIKYVSNGELRASGGYCLLAPSVHPNGTVYKWLNPPTRNNLLVLDPEKAGFMSDVTEHTENTEQTEKTEQTEAIEGKGVREALTRKKRKTKTKVKVESEVEAAIRATQPEEFGTRNRRIFEFARALKSLPQYADADPKELREIVKVWHKRALPNIRTKEFEETWIDFLKAWPRIKYAKGKEPMSKTFEKAIQLELPKIAMKKYPNNSKLKILVSLCRELQRAAGNGPFFLSVRTAGSLLKVSPMQVSRWFFLLQSDGILELVSKGGTAETVRQASRYRYVAG